MDKRSKAAVETIFKEDFMAYQIKVDGLGDLPFAVTLATDKYNFSQHSSLSNLLNSLSEDVPEDDKTPLGPAKDEVDRYFRNREGPEYVIYASLLWWKVCH